MAASASAASVNFVGISAKMSPSSAGILSLRDGAGSSAGRGGPVGWGGKRGPKIRFPGASTFAMLRPSNQESRDTAQNRASLVRWPQQRTEPGTALNSDGDGEGKQQKESDIQRQIEIVRLILRSMGDGEINASAYDTAWVALVAEEDGEGRQRRPRFPSCLEWIAQNQLPDGSWGDGLIFSAHDRVINTLACVIALKTWNHSPRIWKQGLSFLRNNMCKLGEENLEHMPIGFEVAFPSLLEIAKAMDVDLPYDSSVLCKIYEQRQLKLQRIPKEVLHKYPSTLLHSLEGMPDLDWEKLMKLQCKDGSFLFSPSSTAFALMQTKDEGCSRYLSGIVRRFSGGVPNVYPVDLFEHLWVVDRLERLGISRYFEPEIKDCLDYVYRYWTESGICWARNSEVHDVDDTSMGFRLLRMHGYEVSADVFKHFEKGGEFFCFSGQSNQAITGIYNLNRASQLMFPGEKILEDAKVFSYKFLRQKQANNQLLDKWIITKDLPGEVEYALDFPMYANLARVETRLYLDQYGGEKDVWIGKTLYRMMYVNNETYLDLARSDFNHVQSVHKSEVRDVLRWYKDCKFGEYGVSKRILLQSYFLAASVIFEPERAPQRLAWAKTMVLMEAVYRYLYKDGGSGNRISDFLDELQRRDGRWSRRGLAGILLETLKILSLEALVAYGRDISQPLHRAWLDWMNSWRGVEEGGGNGSIAESNEGELLATTVNLCSGRYPQHHPDHKRLTHLTNSVCRQLRRISNLKVPKSDEARENQPVISTQIESEMMELVQSVLKNSKGLDNRTSQTFLDVSKTFYYVAFCPPETMKQHMMKVLFERVA
ncbi:ent-copalyl diphosphate synthase 1 isoform X2 [Nymphaea colorata]|uniref:ent-copalyl diphosphate synthase 1 isoform X2 n=1 Tax=Nymphaea colorata TaxID=210225 RepID=UPI00129DF22C|nr:ent-copalyl diphosphate synthase 1 isoform X2 [Nymphaea colorata]